MPELLLCLVLSGCMPGGRWPSHALGQQCQNAAATVFTLHWLPTLRCPGRCQNACACSSNPAPEGRWLEEFHLPAFIIDCPYHRLREQHVLNTQGQDGAHCCCLLPKLCLSPVERCRHQKLLCHCPLCPHAQAMMPQAGAKRQQRSCVCCCKSLFLLPLSPSKAQVPIQQQTPACAHSQDVLLASASHHSVAVLAPTVPWSSTH